MPEFDNVLIRFKRGRNSNVKNYIPQNGEPLWDLQTKELTVGDGSNEGGVRINKSILQFSGSTIKGRIYYPDDNEVLQFADPNPSVVENLNTKILGVGTGFPGEIQIEFPIYGISESDGKKWLGSNGTIVSSPISTTGWWRVPIGIVRKGVLYVMIDNFNISKVY
jgi:hypothetical protein